MRGEELVRSWTSLDSLYIVLFEFPKHHRFQRQFADSQLDRKSVNKMSLFHPILDCTNRHLSRRCSMELTEEHLRPIDDKTKAGIETVKPSISSHLLEKA